MDKENVIKALKNIKNTADGGSINSAVSQLSSVIDQIDVLLSMLGYEEPAPRINYNDSDEEKKSPDVRTRSMPGVKKAHELRTKVRSVR